MNRSLERIDGRPPGGLGGPSPVAVAHDYRTASNPPNLRERALDEVVETPTRDLRLAAVRCVEDGRVHRVVAEGQSGGVAANRLEQRTLRQEVSQVLAGTPGHLPLGVHANDGGAQQSRLQEDASSPTHRVKDGRCWARSREVRQRPGVEGVHAPRLEERLLGGLALAVLPAALDGEPPEHAPVVCEDRPEFVVGVVEVHGVAAIDQDAPERPFDGLGVDARRPSDVAGADRDGSLPGQGSRVEEGTRALDAGVRPADEFARSVGVGQSPDAVENDCTRGGEARRDHVHVHRGVSGLRRGEAVVLAREFQDVHVTESEWVGLQATES